MATRTAAALPRHVSTALLLCLAAVCLHLSGCASTSEASRQRSVIRSGSAWSKQIALTFDDGPHPGSTPGLLRVLEDAGVRATFFYCGSQAEAHPELVSETLAAGHSVGNHTYSHPLLDEIPIARAREEISRGADAIQSACGVRPRLLRPPGGHYSRRIIAAANELGNTVVLWTVHSHDCDPQDRQFIRNRLLSRAHNGAVMLLHSGYDETVAALPGVIAELRRRGYSFVTVDELLARK